MIGIVFISDILYCPYLDKYANILNLENEEFEVLFWNRENKKIDYPSNFIFFDYESKKNRLPIFKISDFIRYRKWLIKKIKNQKYDKLIILSTLSGMIISDILISKYKKKYIFDIRDYSYENNILFYNIEKKIIKKSYFTCISSNGFKEFLPKEYNYLTVHNFNKSELYHKQMFRKKNFGDRLSVVFIGGVRYFEHQSKIIDRLMNDSRFEMIYHGGSFELDKFIEYCKKNAVRNITFTGEYENKDKNKLLRNADILNNSYKTDKVMEVKYAISNKYYDGLIYGIPQLVETETYKSHIVEKLEIGIGLDPYDKNFANRLYDYYFNINVENFNRTCENELKQVLNDDDKYTKNIKKFLKMENSWG